MMSESNDIVIAASLMFVILTLKMMFDGPLLSPACQRGLKHKVKQQLHLLDAMQDMCV